MEFKLFDSHCHLYSREFDADRAAVLARMQEEQTGAVVIGVDLAASAAALELAKQHDFLYSSVGLHPNDNPTEEFNTEQFEALARDPKVVAVGECGLDYFRTGGSDEERAAQRGRFLKHVELAERVQKPLVIHCRNAHEDMLAILSERKPRVAVIIHFFTASAEMARRYLDLGCYLSFPGPITYTDQYDDAVRATPLNNLLVETDAPYAAPVPHRGKRNEPLYVAHVVAAIAALKSLSVEHVAEVTTQNALKVFRLSARR